MQWAKKPSHATVPSNTVKKRFLDLAFLCVRSGADTDARSSITSDYSRLFGVGSSDFDIFLEIQYASCVSVWPWNPKTSL